VGRSADPNPRAGARVVSWFPIWPSIFGAIVASVMIIMNDDVSDLNDETRMAQLEYLTAAASASIWAIPALPSVILTWTLRNEKSAADNPDRPKSPS
jgi:hypothetical protein